MDNGSDDRTPVEHLKEVMEPEPDREAPHPLDGAVEGLLHLLKRDNYTGRVIEGVQVITSLETVYRIVITQDDGVPNVSGPIIGASNRDKLLDYLYERYGLQPDNNHVGVPLRSYKPAKRR